jgi:hypothetical protein
MRDVPAFSSAGPKVIVANSNRAVTTIRLPTVFNIIITSFRVFYMLYFVQRLIVFLRFLGHKEDA